MTPHQQQNAKALELLELVARFGSLLSTQIARKLYPSIKPASAQRQTQRLIKALTEQGLSLAKRSTQFEPQEITLAEKGARTLRSHGINAKTGKDLKAGRHRKAINDTLISAMLDDYLIFTEHEIITERAPVKEFNGKIPDGLLYKREPDGTISACWLEVEATRRGGRDLNTICEWLLDTLPNERNQSTHLIATDSEDLRLNGVLFVLAVPAAEGLEERIRSKLTQMTDLEEVESLMKCMKFIIPEKKAAHVQILDTKKHMDKKIEV